MLEMPVLETPRLLIRPFVLADYPDVHRLLDGELDPASLHTEALDSGQERAEWLQWTVLNYRQLAKLNQPPYGDRAMVLRQTGQIIGACGYVPCLAPFGQLPGLGGAGRLSPFSTEFGLFYAVSPSSRRQGYAAEAAQALVDYAFQELHVRRIVATTDFENAGSLGVMRRLGMRIERNPLPEPPWLQAVGVLERADAPYQNF